MWTHEHFEDILILIRDMKREGKTSVAIKNELTRRGFESPAVSNVHGKPKPGWTSYHILQSIDLLRARGELPENEVMDILHQKSARIGFKGKHLRI